MLTRAYLVGLLGALIALTACSAPQVGATPTASPSTATPSQVPPPPLPTSTPMPTAVPTPTGPMRVILISLDGGRADWLSAWMADGTMPTLAALAERGLWGTVQSVEPPTSGVVHASLACGCLPAETGIVGERVHRPEDSFYWYTSAYDLPSVGGTPIWEVASQSGLTTATLFWPGGLPASSDQTAAYVVNYGERIAYSAQHTMALVPASTWENAPPSYSPLLEGQFSIGDRDEPVATIYILLADTTDDQNANYNQIILSNGDRVFDFPDPIMPVEPGRWIAWTFDSVQMLGADFLITGLSTGSLTLYQSAVYSLSASPDELGTALLENLGFLPPPADYYALEHGWISSVQYREMIARQSAWIMSATLWVYQTYQPDLLLTVQSPLKQAGHQFLMVDQRQPGYSNDVAAQYQQDMALVASQLDAELSRLVEATQLEVEGGRLALLVVGSTGMSPIHTQVNLNTVLEQAGLLRLDWRDYVVVEQSQAIAFASGGAAHIYINLAGRERGGVVPQESYADVQERIIEALNQLTDPVSGEPIFERVMRQNEASALGIGGPYAGDVFVQASPGYLLSDQRGMQEVFEPVVYYGQQGYRSDLPAMQGGFVAVGRGIVSGSEIDLVNLTDIAPTLCGLLGIDQPPAMIGEPLGVLLGQ